jgi:hypothetical protein
MKHDFPAENPGIIEEGRKKRKKVTERGKSIGV